MSKSSESSHGRVIYKSGQDKKGHDNPIFGGHNGIQQHEHIRHMKYPNGNQGFSERGLGRDTIPGPAKGAPLSTKKEQLISVKHVDVTGMNPYNHIEANDKGVLGAHVIKQDGGHTYDSPVPEHAERPNIAIKDKASEVRYAEAKYGPENDFPSDGIMHRD
jgi:hypothetical protein